MVVQDRNSKIEMCPICGEDKQFEMPHPIFKEQIRIYNKDCRCVREAAAEAVERRREEAWRVRKMQIRKLFQMDGIGPLGQSVPLEQTFQTWDRDINPSVNDIEDRCEAYAQGFVSRHPRHGYLIRSEVKGCGKSHLLMAISNYLLEVHQIEAITAEFPLIVATQRRFAASNEVKNQMLDLLLSAPFVALNDISRFKCSEWSLELLFRILETRLRLRIPTAFSANQPLTDWGNVVKGDSKEETARLVDLVQACVSRMTQAASLLYIEDAKDYRDIIRETREREEGLLF